MIHVRRLIWDDWNVAHIARHDVTPAEVEEVCHGSPIADETYADRLRLIGATVNGNLLTVILAPQNEVAVYYPVTARPSSKKERRRYRARKGGESE